jgi:hypothetical protein
MERRGRLTHLNNKFQFRLRTFFCIYLFILLLMASIWQIYLFILYYFTFLHFNGMEKKESKFFTWLDTLSSSTKYENKYTLTTIDGAKWSNVLIRRNNLRKKKSDFSTLLFHFLFNFQVSASKKMWTFGWSTLLFHSRNLWASRISM